MANVTAADFFLSLVSHDAPSLDLQANEATATFSAPALPAVPCLQIAITVAYAEAMTSIAFEVMNENGWVAGGPESESAPGGFFLSLVFDEYVNADFAPEHASSRTFNDPYAPNVPTMQFNAIAALAQSLTQSAYGVIHRRGWGDGVGSFSQCAQAATHISGVPVEPPLGGRVPE